MIEYIGGKSSNLVW